MYMCMKYLLVSAEQVSRSRMLNQSSLQVYHKMFSRKVVPTLTFPKLTVSIFQSEVPGWISLCLLRGPKTLSFVGTSKSSRGKIPPVTGHSCSQKPQISSQLILILFQLSVTVPVLDQEMKSCGSLPRSSSHAKSRVTLRCPHKTPHPGQDIHVTDESGADPPRLPSGSLQKSLGH